MKKFFKIILIILLTIITLIAGLFLYLKIQDNKIDYSSDDTKYVAVDYNEFAYLSDDNTILNLDIPNGYLFFRYFDINLINNNLADMPMKINDIGLKQVDDHNLIIYLGADFFNFIRVPLICNYEYEVSEIDTKVKLKDISIANLITLNREKLDSIDKSIASDLDIHAKYYYIYERMGIYSVFIEEISDYDDALHIKYRIKDATYHYVVDTHFDTDLKLYKSEHPELVDPGPIPTYEKYFKELVEYYNNIKN